MKYVDKKITLLNRDFDPRYFPEPADIAKTIGDFYSNLPAPTHPALTGKVLQGRKCDFKNFVITFDKLFDDSNDLPTGFRFSNKAMASIINIVLDVPVDKLVTSTTIRVARNRNIPAPL